MKKSKAERELLQALRDYPVLTDCSSGEVATKEQGGIDKFHAHLDVCEQCREHPFALCPTGDTLLRQAATGITKWIAQNEHNEK